MIVVDILPDGPAQMPLSERDEPIEAFAPNGKNEPLGESVQVRAARGEADHLDPLACESIAELSGVERVSIDDQLALPSQEARRLIEVTERSLGAGIEQLRAGTRLHEVGRAVQAVD